MPVEELASTILANRLAAREYFESQAALFSEDEFERALAEIPDVEPEERDRT